MAGTSARPNPWPTLGKLLAAMVAAGVILAGLVLPYVGGLGLAARQEASKFLNTTCNLTESKPPQKTTLLSRDGKVIATLFSQDRVPVPLTSVPLMLQKALVATEDRRFYSHHGVDMRGLIRSAVSTSGGDTQGGSTLTMQYVKQIRYYEAGDDLKKQRAAIAQNLSRKIEDAKCAIYIVETLKESKDTILQNYLNIAFFG
ncbi:MAG: biosynthetic peptidoglycan transglycosylase, partial [Jatrophihabitantaceae bacterium]